MRENERIHAKGSHSHDFKIHFITQHNTTHSHAGTLVWDRTYCVCDFVCM